MTAKETLKTPIGKIYAHFEQNSLCELSIGKASHSVHSTRYQQQTLNDELQAYFKNFHHQFDIPITVQGTDFQKRVWSALRKIPAGKTLTYGELANKLGSSARAVGNACRANPVPIIIPCHRVVGKKGIGGYDGKTSGARLDIKRWLLNHEGVVVN